MKKILTIILLTITFTSSSQFHLNTDDEYFNARMSVDPHSTIKDDFINTGFDVEYVGTIYIKAGIEVHTGLEPNYFDWHFGSGLNLMIDRWELMRSYVGARFGRINREGLARVTLVAFEAGIDFNLADGFILGLNTTYASRTEGKFLGYDNYWRLSGFVVIGIRL